jgi:aldose 1-epimerase
MFKIQNNNGMSVELINTGATVFSINVPDKNGRIENVALGFDNPEDYKNNSVYFGTTAGRYGNRIAKGKFRLDDKEYTLTLNNNGNHLHGGIKGINQLWWKEQTIEPAEAVFTCFSPDGDQGYPGNLEVTVCYSLTSQNGLRIEFEASSDAPTILNLTNHSYFNLNGKPGSNILDHEIYINADKFTPVDKTMIPTGELRLVNNTTMDFRKPKAAGRDILRDDEQLQFGCGYDHNFVLNGFDGSVRKIASVFDPKSKRLMEVYSDQPGVQFYSGNYLQGVKGKQGVIYKKHSGLCLEAQGFPDAPNKPHFPSTVLRPGGKYKHVTEYRFSNI